MSNPLEIKAFVHIDEDTSFVTMFTSLPRIGDEIVLRDAVVDDKGKPKSPKHTDAKVIRVVHNLDKSEALGLDGCTSVTIQVICERFTK